jgi:hypothetical protein
MPSHVCTFAVFIAVVLFVVVTVVVTISTASTEGFKPGQISSMPAISPLPAAAAIPTDVNALDDESQNDATCAMCAHRGALHAQAKATFRARPVSTLQFVP